jgi:PPOX class probable F420-dependent enzyme
MDEHDADGQGVAGALDARFPGKYLSVTSFKRDGNPVATPVWFVIENGRLLIYTGPDSFKAKRIRRNPAVQIAACNATGGLRGDQMPGTAEFLPDSETDHVMRLIKHKYRVDRVLKLPFYNFVQRLKGNHPNGPIVTLAITPLADDARSGSQPPGAPVS